MYMRFLWIVLFFSTHMFGAKSEIETKADKYEKAVKQWIQLQQEFKQIGTHCEKKIKTMLENMSTIISGLNPQDVSALNKAYNLQGAAIEFDCAPLLQSLYKKNINVASSPVHYFGSSLHAAVYKHAFHCGKFLLEKAIVDPNKQDKNGMTPLHLLMRSNESSCFAHLLLKHGASIEVKDNAGLKPTDCFWLIDYAKHYQPNQTQCKQKPEDLLTCIEVD